MDLISAQPDTDTPTADTPTDDVFDDPTTNPRAELEALERAHLLIANAAAQRILEHQYEIEELRPIVFEHRAKATAINPTRKTAIRHQQYQSLTDSLNCVPKPIDLGTVMAYIGRVVNGASGDSHGASCDLHAGQHGWADHGEPEA
jgi:hypothetical protein